MKIAALILTMFLAAVSAAGQITSVKNDMLAQLSNTNFADRASAEKVTELRDRLAELKIQVATLNNNLDALS